MITVRRDRPGIGNAHVLLKSYAANAQPAAQIVRTRLATRRACQPLGKTAYYCGDEPPPVPLEDGVELPPVVLGLVPLPGVELPGLVVVLLPEVPPELDGELPPELDGELLPEFDGELLPELPPALALPPAPEAPEAPEALEPPDPPLVLVEVFALSLVFFLVELCFLLVWAGVPLASYGVADWACASCCARPSTTAIFCGSVLSVIPLVASCANDAADKVQTEAKMAMGSLFMKCSL